MFLFPKSTILKFNLETRWQIHNISDVTKPENLNATNENSTDNLLEAMRSRLTDIQEIYNFEIENVKAHSLN